MYNVYKIVNDVNDFVYVGITRRSIFDRFKEHIKPYMHSSRWSPFYKAIRDIGREHFSVELIEICSDEDAEIRERYWIDFYKNHGGAYNIASGGFTNSKLSDDDIKDILTYIKSGKTLAEVGRMFSVDDNTVSLVCKKYNVDYSRSTLKYIKSRSIPVDMFSVDGEYICSFESLHSAVLFICEEKNKNTKNKDGMCGHIIASIKRNGTSYGYRWKYKSQ